jgi:hypothetical protein
MKDKVYIETSVVSYLTGRPSRDVVIAAHQELTRQWWETQSSKYELLISELVLEEAAGGDSDAAQRRIQAIRDLHILRTSESAVELATHLVSMRLTPQEYAADAMHIAIAAVNGTDYLLTWNCKHIANAKRRQEIESAIEVAGFASPVICTPEELMED